MEFLNIKRKLSLCQFCNFVIFSNLGYFKLRLFGLTENIVCNIKGCKGKEMRKTEIVAKNKVHF